MTAMKRTSAAAILIAIAVAISNAPTQATAFPFQTQYYSVSPGGYQVYQSGYPVYQYGYPVQQLQPQYYPYQTQQSLPTPPAQLETVVGSDFQQFGTPEVDLSYLDLPTKSPAPAPSIPPQPGDLAFQTKSRAPAPSIPPQPEDLAAQVKTTPSVSNLVLDSKGDLEVTLDTTSQQPTEVVDSTELDSNIEEATVEPLALDSTIKDNNADLAPGLIDLAEVTEPTESPAIQGQIATIEPAKQIEPKVIIEPAVAIEPAVEVESAEVAATELATEVEAPAPQPVQFDSANETNVVETESAITDTPAETASTEAQTPAVPTVIATTKTQAQTPTATSPVAVKPQRSNASGTWWLALLPLFTLPALGWFGINKWKAKQARLAEEAFAAARAIADKRTNDRIDSMKNQVKGALAAATRETVSETTAKPSQTVETAAPKLAPATTDTKLSTEKTKPVQPAKPAQDLDVTAEAQKTTQPKTQDAVASSTSKPKALTPTVQVDDLTEIRGIGPVTAALLGKSGINSFRDLSESGIERLQDILTSGGSKFDPIDPSTWASQARFAMLSVKQTETKSVTKPTPTVTDTIVIEPPAFTSKPVARTTPPTVTVDSDKPEAAPASAASLTTPSVATSRPVARTTPATVVTDSDKPTSKSDAGTTSPTVVLESDKSKAATTTPTVVTDELTKILGIGPLTQKLLQENGIGSFEKLASMTSEQLKEFFAKQESRFQLLDPTTWPAQAKALATDLNAESALLDEINAIRGIASTSTSDASTTKTDSPVAPSKEATSK